MTFVADRLRDEPRQLRLRSVYNTPRDTLHNISGDTLHRPNTFTPRHARADPSRPVGVLHTLRLSPSRIT
jgi:hypothetical protein